MLAALIFMLCVGVASASGVAETTPLTPEERLQLSSEELQDLLAGDHELEGSQPDLSAANELPHSNLGRGEAEELVTEVFGSVIDTEALDLLPTGEARSFRSDYAAVVEDADGGAALVESLLPLRDRDQNGELAPVDLSIERNASEDLEPSNPLVDLTIPGSLGESVWLPEAKIGISIAGLADRDASISGNAAFFANVATDTDVLIAPTAQGFETHTQLRSPDAPTTEVFELDLPPGGSLTDSKEGGAVVREGDDELLRILPPAAIDAAGRQVPVQFKVQGDDLVMKTEPDELATYPILVDPVFTSNFNWSSQHNTSGIGTEWIPSWNSDRFYTTSIGEYGEQGLNIYSFQGGAFPGAQGNWNYYVPRYTSDWNSYERRPTSFIQQITFTDLRWWIVEPQPFKDQPMLWMGLWDESKGWNTIGTRTGSQGQMFDQGYTYVINNAPQNDGSPTVQVKYGGIALATTDGSTGYRHLLVGQASVSVGDNDKPEVEEIQNPSAWMNSQPGSVGFVALDRGLGVSRMSGSAPQLTGGKATITKNQGCIGSSGSPCPRTWSGVVPIDPQSLAQGEHYVPLTAQDPTGNASASAMPKVKIDHSAPALSLSGNLTEQAIAGTNLREYGLNYTAKDGDDAAAAALSPWGTAGKAEKQLERPMGVAVAADGSVYAVDRLNNRVIKYDTEGKPVLQFGSTGSGDGQFNDPRGIDIAPDGTVWVADMGNDRIQAFGPTGTFLRKAKFTDPASEPYAIASGPGGVLWVTDIGLKRVVKLSEDPLSTLLITTGKEPGGNGKGTAVISPTGVATDKYGNVWIADGGLGKVLELDSAGKPLFSFGTGGSGDGQIDGIVGIDVSPVGNIAITERNNGRVQIFKPDGSYLRKFGSAGPGNNQFSEAGGLSFGPDNMLAVADAGNKRIARWAHADQDPQSGTAKVEVKVDGTTVSTKAPGCTTKNCQVSGSWTLDADEFAGGAHKLEVVATDAVGIPQTKTLDIQTHGDHTDPTIALSGTMTQQASIGTTRPSYKLKAVATDPGPTEELKSGVAATVVKVDGATVDSSSPGCPAGGCSITREWTLNSESYSVGSHTVEVKATDVAGRVSTKTLTIDIARDTTPPNVSYTGAFYSAPSGWLEQKQVGYAALASDSGYGVTSVELKIDGAVVNSATQTCAVGGCLKFFASGQTLDMASYSGGAHPAEFVARDGAGNAAKRTWTINVDPEGHISASEAEDTLEAVEGTSEATPIAPNEDLLDPEQMEFGDNPSMVDNGEELESDGVPDTTKVDSATGEITIIGPKDGMVVTPVAQPGPEISSKIAATVAALLSNSGVHTDSVIRPQYNGAMQFSQIRDASAPETYSWSLNLDADQHLVLVDSDQAEVRYEDGVTAYLITAEKAHDATGAAVGTAFSVSGNTITLTVKHRTPGVVYPVLAGQAFETSYTVGTVAMPPTEAEVLESQGEMAPRDPFPPTIGQQINVGEMKWLKKMGPVTFAAEAPVAGDGTVREMHVFQDFCHPVSCDTWEVWQSGPDYKVLRSTIIGSEWIEGSKMHCTTDTDFPASLALEVEPLKVSLRNPPWYAIRGEGKKLITYCHHRLNVFAVPEDVSGIPGVPSPEVFRVMITFVYPNGYQTSVLRNTDYDGPGPEIVEN